MDQVRQVDVDTDHEALENWWAELPGRERSQALRLLPGVPLPEEFVVGLLLAGFTLPSRPNAASPVEQPRALRELLERENSRRDLARTAARPPTVAGAWSSPASPPTGRLP